MFIQILLNNNHQHILVVILHHNTKMDLMKLQCIGLMQKLKKLIQQTINIASIVLINKIGQLVIHQLLQMFKL